jgi:hypothetical protein
VEGPELGFKNCGGARSAVRWGHHNRKKNGKSVRREWMKADLKIKDHSRPERPVAKYRRQLGERLALAEGLTYLSVQMVA